jgi:macrolide transport system ATP-binding/permease protein
MSGLRQLPFRLQPIYRRKRIEEELSDEIRAHFEMALGANLAEGMSSDEGRLAAHRLFGGVGQVKESYRDERGIPSVDHLFQEWRFAVGSTRVNPMMALKAG